MKEDRKNIKSGVTLEKIAYYVQRLKDSDVRKTILVMKYHFCDNDLIKFAENYKNFQIDNNVKYIANLLISVPSKIWINI
jgi:hypothetical protein